MRVCARSCWPLVLVCLSLVVLGCDVYERQRIGAVASDAAMATDARPPAMDATQPDAAATPQPDASQPPFDPKSCSWGDCWWSTGGSQGECRSAGKPSESDRPASASDGSDPDESDVYLGFTKIRLGTTNRDGMTTPDAWQDFGLDLDGKCTNSSTCEDKSSVVGCRSQTDTLPFDGQLCRDNTLARLQPVVADIPEIGDRYGISEDVFNCALWLGSYNVVMRLAGWNGKSSDSRVRVDFYITTGIEEPLPWSCESGVTGFRDRYPRWRSSQRWRVDDADLTAPIAESGAWPDSKVADADAYVKNGYLVARLPPGARIGFIGNGSPHRGFMLRAQQGMLVGRLQRAQDGTWEIADGLSAGRIRNEDLLLAFREVGFCEGGAAASFYAETVSYIEENADVLASGESNPELPCDAMSYAIGFESAQLTPGRGEALPPRIECCPPDKTDEQCSSVCGDGRVSGDEKCDTAVAAGSDGACPTACSGGEACAPLTLQGSQCTTECAPSQVTDPTPDDGCCPEGANGLTDNDCDSQCGNAVVEPGETCDLPATCPTCTTNNACLVLTTMGTPDSCNIACVGTLVSACMPGDGCCPVGCTRTNDSDCSDSCRNGVVETDETCEPSTDKPCATSCEDEDGCTLDQMTGSAANCNVRCEHTPITQSAAGDRCCPAGATSNIDSDCQTECGNAVVEAGEQCDDGNATAGDGCTEQCMRENPEQSCLARLADEKPECAQCTCRMCAQEALTCQDVANAEDRRLCDEMVQCARETGCRSSVCYCGTVDAITCLSFPNGMCIEQVVAAAKTGSALDIQARETDSNYPLGRAVALGECVDEHCMAECL